jgi:hypothetical protein
MDEIAMMFTVWYPPSPLSCGIMDLEWSF